MPLTGNQRKKLKSNAHHLKPIVQVGQKGLTETLIKSVDEALESRELIKIKFIEYKNEKKELSVKIASETGAEVIGSIGNIVILYRKKKDKE